MPPPVTASSYVDDDDDDIQQVTFVEETPRETLEEHRHPAADVSKVASVLLSSSSSSAGLTKTSRHLLSPLTAHIDNAASSKTVAAMDVSAAERILQSGSVFYLHTLSAAHAHTRHRVVLFYKDARLYICARQATATVYQKPLMTIALVKHSFRWYNSAQTRALSAADISKPYRCLVLHVPLFALSKASGDLLPLMTRHNDTVLVELESRSRHELNQWRNALTLVVTHAGGRWD